MQHERVTGSRSQVAMVVGWISTADALFVGLILTLTVTLFVASRLQRSRAENRQTQGDVGTLRGQLNQVQGRVADLQKERDRLTQDNSRLKEMAAQTAAQLTPLRSERDRQTVAAAKAAEEGNRLAAENERLTAKLAACRDYYVNMKKTLEQTTAEKQDAAIRLVAAIEERDVFQRESQALRSRIEAEPGLHKELIGLKGPLRRVVVVFDTSGSMGQDGRWEHARSVVATWLEHLAISECALVLFSTDARVFPHDGSFLDVRGPAGEANRKRLLEPIRYTKPEGGTNTLLALQMAYQCPELDTIILFTDGEPNSGHSDQFDPEVAERIYALCRQHKTIPVNTVGLGNYFKPQLSGFLMRVAQETGGSFLGR